jgi:hypothetical protein
MISPELKDRPTRFPSEAKLGGPSYFLRLNLSAEVS